MADLHFHDLRQTFATRATLLGHRLRGLGYDQLGGESMTAAYSHGGYGWKYLQMEHYDETLSIMSTLVNGFVL